MSATINVKELPAEEGFAFEVIVKEDGSQTYHRVSMGANFYQELNTQVKPEEVIKESFEFLLEREAKEMILSEFDVTMITKYFPEYEQELKKRLES